MMMAATVCLTVAQQGVNAQITSPLLNNLIYHFSELLIKLRPFSLSNNV